MNAPSPVRSIGLAALVAVILFVPHAGAADDSLAAANATLRREQSLSEDYVTLLETVGKEDLRSYAICVRGYATARSEFNGFIEGIKTHLIEGTAVEQSESFTATLDNAVSTRRTFTGCVDKLIEDLGKTKGVKDYITGASELGKLLLDAGKTIWQEYKSAKEAKRKAMLDQLESLKWKRFSEQTASSSSNRSKTPQNLASAR